MNDMQITFDSDAAEKSNSFSYEGFQIVRGEFFSHISEPSITFSGYKLSVNTACLKKLPNEAYIHFLVNSKTRKMIIKPCGEDEKDSLRWRLSKEDKIIPRRVSCKFFFEKLAALMKWNNDLRYKLLGTLIESSGEKIILFDLTAAEAFTRRIKDNETQAFKNAPEFPEEWDDQFGVTVEEHLKSAKINIFDGYAVLKIKEENGKNNSEAVTENEENKL